MKVAVFSTKPYDRQYLAQSNQAFGHELSFFTPSLNPETVELARGSACVCVFVNDLLNKEVLRCLFDGGTQLIALRCAGYDNVDLAVARELGIEVVRVPAYSPYSVAEHAVALILTLNRKIHRAYNRTREGNFSLEGLMGLDPQKYRSSAFGLGSSE